MTPPLVPRRREWSSRVRSGCTTCKKRHIKCDERRPGPCSQCENLSFKCEYPDESTLVRRPRNARPPREIHAILPSGSNGSNLQLLVEPTSTRLDAQQALYFDFYRHHVAKQWPCKEFWTRAILRESVRDESIRDCVVALGALAHALRMETAWRHPDNQQPKSSSVDMAHQGATGRYLQALSRFRVRLESNSTTSPRSILMVTWLFVIFELMQGNLKAADGLMVRAIVMLRQQLAILHEKPSSGSQLAAALDDDGVREVEFILARMVALNPLATPFHPFHAKLEEFGYRAATKVAQIPMPGDDASVDNVVIAWDVYTTRSALWLCRIERGDALSTPEAIAATHSMQRRLLQANSDWESLTRRKLSQERTEENRIKLKAVLVCIKIAKPVLSCSLDKTEMEWDAFTADFEEALQVAESIVFSKPLASTLESIHDTKLIWMVRIILQRSRKAHIRKRATTMLRLFVNNDSTWDAKSYVMGSEMLALEEEKWRDSSGHIPWEKRYKWTGCAWNVDRTEFTVSLIGTTTGDAGRPTELLVRARPQDFGFW